MKTRHWMVFPAALVMAIWTTTAEAQYRRPYSRGAGGFGGGGSFLAGQGALSQGMGQSNRAHSQAAINYQQAHSAYLDNRRKSVQVYFERRRMNASFRAEMRRPAPTPEEIIAFNQARIPDRLSPEQLDPGQGGQGSLHWPAVLRGSEFDELRSRLDGLFAERALHPYDAGLGSANYRQIRHLTDKIRDRLKSSIGQITPDEFIVGNRFLKSLSYEARFERGANPAG
ncbi:MAG TPA: hypothetical protein VMV69_13850 [Pirellulales bacterium]|nr:hypothetical protein [Pirellulales bacterium]